MDTSSFRQCSDGLVFMRVHQCQEIVVKKVCITHRRCKVSVAHSLLDQDRALSFRQPGSDPAVPEVMLVEVGRQLGPLHCGREGPVEALEPVTCDSSPLG